MYSLFKKFIQGDLNIWGNSRQYFFLGFALGSTGSLAADTSIQASNSNTKQTHADFIHSETLRSTGAHIFEGVVHERRELQFYRSPMDPVTILREI